MSQWLIFDEVHATVGDSSWVTIDASVLSSASKDLNNYINYEITNNNKTQFYIKNGTYNLSDSIIINKPGIKIYGESNSGTIIYQTNNAAKTIVILKDDIEISNLYIDGSIGKEVIHAQDNLALNYHINNANINNCIIYGPTTNAAIAFFGVGDADRRSNNIIQNNEIHSTVINSATRHEAIVFQWQQDGKVIDNTIYGSDLYAYHCENVNLSNNIIEDSNIEPGIKVNLSGNNITINNNNIKNTTEAGISIVVDSGVTTKYSGIDVENNTIDTTQYIGIEVNNVSDGVISNNIVRNTQFEGINIDSSNNLIIDGNNVSNSGKRGIKVVLVGDNVKVRNNTISNIHDSAIAIVKGSNDILYNGIEVTDNNITNTYHFGIEINNLYGGIITGNRISKTDYYGMYLLKSDNLIVENNSILDSELQSGNGDVWASSVKASIYLETGIITGVLPNLIAGNNANISNNYLYNNISNNPNACPYGIVASNSSSANDINNNLIIGNFTQALNITGANSITYIQPGNLNTTATDHSITLKWDPIGSTTDPAIRYEINIDGSATWSDVGNVITYVDNNVHAGETHIYRVRVKQIVNSDYIANYNSVANYTPKSQTADSYLAPILTVGDYTDESIEIKWNIVGVSYEIQLDGSLIANGVNGSNYIKHGLTSDTTYKFKVRIVGQSQWSNEVTQKTKALIPVIVVPPTTPPAVITTPPAVITTPPAVVTTPSAATTKRKKKHKAFVEITVDEYKKILYKENLIYDYEEKKLKRIIEYSFKYQSHYYLKKIKDGKVIEAEEFKVDLVPEDLFSEQEIRNALIGKNDNIDTIIVRDFSNKSNTNEKNDLSQYSEEKESILTIKNNNTEVETIETYRKDIKNLER
ncbi:right-handed parallel beta-helix repeat-containing protein [Clostridium saccharoperbutylacetonicum]